jgi:hypothetical protein
VTLRKLLRYKLLHIQYACKQPGVAGSSLQKTQLLTISSARFGANCVALLGGFEGRIGHQAAQAPTKAEVAEWRNLWNLLSAWYGRPSSETFVPSSLLERAKERRGRA